MYRHRGSNVDAYQVRFYASKQGADHKRCYKGLANKQVREWNKRNIKEEFDTIYRDGEEEKWLS